ncbi:DUF4192 domain-containing protein [Saccharothrix sp.]|uniref:DUF4192 domain-containing protein n=1 Tax=Saccharothrix sp. TaxID=1873460 RepID=UPI0028128445|nr:DUF4192 domain-containing protein [Saccharothrix sp.]
MTDDSAETVHVDAPRHASVELSDPGRLIAVIPHLIGFQPTDALVLIALHHGDIVVTAWYDLSDASTSARGLADEVAATTRHLHDAVFVACIVGDDPDQANTQGRRLLHKQLVTTFATQNRDIHVYGVRDVSAGARWFDYSLPDHRHGTLPDPDISPAATAAAHDTVVHPSYEALAATLEPDNTDDVTRRSNLIDSILTNTANTSAGDKGETRRLLALVRKHIEQAAHRVDPLTDREVAELAIALSNLEVRDLALAFALGEHAAHAEQLWTELTRKAPAPERAEPAALLAMFAYLRGNVTLARLALRQAETAHPTHRLATLTRIAITVGMSPVRFRRVAEFAEERATLLGEDRL